MAHCGFRLVTDSGTNANRNEAFAKFLLAWLMDFFWRLGDTKCIEETHRLGRGVEQRGQQPDLLSCRVFYQLMQGLHTPLQARGVPHLCIDQSAPCSASCKKQNWRVVFGTRSRAKLPGEALVKNVRKTPVSTRRSICAAVALVHLHRGNHWSDAQHLWQGVALLPHRLVRDEQSVYLILAQGRWAARAWVATPLKSPSPGLEDVDAWLQPDPIRKHNYFTETLL